MNRERLEIGGATSRLGNRSHYEIGDPMQPANLESEFDLAYRNRTQEHRQHLAGDARPRRKRLPRATTP